MQHESQTSNQNNITPKAEQRRLLCCNKVVCRCSALEYVECLSETKLTNAFDILFEEVMRIKQEKHL